MSTDVIRSQPAATLSSRWTPPYAALTLVGIVVMWQLASYLFAIPSYLLPSPAAILADMVNRWPILLANAWITIFEVVFGFVISVLVGIPLAVCVTYSRPLDRAIYPLIVGSQTIPKVAIAPLLLAWFGFGLTPKITIVALVEAENGDLHLRTDFLLEEDDGPSRIVTVASPSSARTPATSRKCCTWRVRWARRPFRFSGDFVCPMRCRACLPA